MSMTRPRMIEPDTYHHIVRRCVGRQFLLLPDAEVRNLVVYCFAVGSARFQVEVLRITVMSNHYHANVFDREGRLPEFLNWVHRTIALGLQRVRRIQGAIFEPSKSTGDQILASEEGFWKMMRYTHTNPTEAQLVKRPNDWPGTLTPAGTRQLDATRPSWMTDRCGPERATLRIHVPDHFVAEQRGESKARREDRYHEMLRESDAEATREARMRLRTQGRHRFVGAEQALNRSPKAAPCNVHRKPSRSPRFVAVVAVAFEAIRTKLRAFQQAYREALSRFHAGERNVPFPDGTWRMRRLLSATSQS